MHRYRTDNCGTITKNHVDHTIRVSGWINSVRDHGGVVFIDLRDQTGIVQAVLYPTSSSYKGVEHWHSEMVLCITGKVVERSKSTVNPKMATGAIEIEAGEVEVLGDSASLPFPVNSDEVQADHVRLKYRYLDLRRSYMHENIIFRTKVIEEIRRLMTARGFREINTPVLTSSSPEGARDFLVPSRLHPGQFYALPQAPQQFKQLLMVAGFEKYFQIAPCFRDEDARADRSPGEFYQLDIEMSYVTQEDIFTCLEDVLYNLFNDMGYKKVGSRTFTRIKFKDAMDRYGTDKPDLRNPLQMVRVTDIFQKTGFNAFAGVIKKGGIVKAIHIKDAAANPRKFFDDMIAFAQGKGAKGMAYIVWKEGKAVSPIVKFLSDIELEKITSRFNIKDGDVVFFLADQERLVNRVGYHVMGEAARRLDIIDDSVYRFCWIVDFPMYEYNEELKKIDFSHNPFSMPQGGLQALQEQDPLEVLAYQYDIVCDGVELSSGAIRNNSRSIMEKAFAVAGYDKSILENKFSSLYEAFRYGAPPHGGIAPGLDRMVMLLKKVNNIREIIPFPMNQSAQDLMMGAPNNVNPEQLEELHIKPDLDQEAE